MKRTSRTLLVAYTRARQIQSRPLWRRRHWSVGLAAAFGLLEQHWERFRDEFHSHVVRLGLGRLPKSFVGRAPSRPTVTVLHL